MISKYWRNQINNGTKQTVDLECRSSGLQPRRNASHTLCDVTAGLRMRIRSGNAGRKQEPAQWDSNGSRKGCSRTPGLEGQVQLKPRPRNMVAAQCATTMDE